MKKIDDRNICQKIKDGAKKAFHELGQYLKYNRQFVTYVILCLISCSLVRYFTIGNFFDFYAIFFDLAMLIIMGCFVYFIKPKRQFWYFLFLIIFVTIINFVNAIYYSFFNSFASVSMLSTMGQASEQGGAVFEKLKLVNFVYLLMPIIFVITNRILNRIKYFNVVEKIENGKKLFMSVGIVGLITLFINIATLTSTDFSRFAKQWNREYIVERFGIIVYQANDIVQTAKSSLTSLFGYEEAANNFVEYYTENQIPKSNNKMTDKYKNYNVIFVHMESIMQFLIGLEINGKEVTPNLNKLVGDSLYFDNFYAQVSVGTSSDTEFTLNTSLMPVQSGTVFVSYYNRNYNSIEKILQEKGYYTFSMHANKASMWNRAKMHKSLGYLDFYSKEYFEVNDNDIVGLGLNDHQFFLQAESIITDINKMVKESDEYKNYMGTMITLSNHTPFDIENYLPEEELFDVTYHTGEKDKDGNEIVQDYLEGTTIGSYIKSAHYADKCLGEFIEYVKNSPDYNKTLFVMYGDLAAQLSKNQFKTFVNYDFETGEQKNEDSPNYAEYDYYSNEIFKKVPLIIWSKDGIVKGKYSYPMGMIDVQPTVNNMLGVYNKYALGHDIFEIKNDNTVVFPNGNFLTNKVYYYNSKNEFRVLSTDTSINDKYITERKEYAEKILDVSNDIIVYDLIEKASERLEEN